MAMSEEHKAALALGRRESRAIKAYLEAIDTPRRRGRPVTVETLEARIAILDEKIRTEADPLTRVHLIQTRLDTEDVMASVRAAADLSELEAGFVTSAASYSERKSVSYTAWREAGVPASVLKEAGVRRTRR